MVGYADPKGAIWGRVDRRPRAAKRRSPRGCEQPVVVPRKEAMHEANSQPGTRRLRRPPRSPPLSPLRRLRRHARSETRPRAPDHGPARGARHAHGEGRRALRRGDRQARHHQGHHGRQPAPAARHALQPADGQDPASAASGRHVQAAARGAARRDARHQELLVHGRPARHAAPRRHERLHHGQLHQELPDHHRRHPEDARDRSHGRRSAGRPARHRKVRRRGRAQPAPVHAARRQGADRPAHRPAGARRPGERPVGRRRPPTGPIPTNDSSVVAFAESFVNSRRTCGAVRAPPASTARASPCTATATSA